MTAPLTDQIPSSADPDGLAYIAPDHIEVNGPSDRAALVSAQERRVRHCDDRAWSQSTPASAVLSAGAAT